MLLLAVLIAALPFAAVVVLLAWTGRRERVRQDVCARQIALTDRIHARLGAVVAPVVRYRRRTWQVSMAVPFESPATMEAVMEIVRVSFTPADRDPRPVEIILRRQPRPAAAPRRRGDVRRELLSWT
jgi:hypothetical protein